MQRATSIVLAVVLSGMLVGCGNAQSRLVGHWQSTSEQNININIEEKGDVFTVEVVQNGQIKRLRPTYKDGTLTVQTRGGTISIYPDKNSSDLIANMNGREDRLQRQ